MIFFAKAYELLTRAKETSKLQVIYAAHQTQLT